jgi:hypothetical protein
VVKHLSIRVRHTARSSSHARHSSSTLNVKVQAGKFVCSEAYVNDTHLPLINASVVVTELLNCHLFTLLQAPVVHVCVQHHERESQYVGCVCTAENCSIVVSIPAPALVTDVQHIEVYISNMLEGVSANAPTAVSSVACATNIMIDSIVLALVTVVV